MDGEIKLEREYEIIQETILEKTDDATYVYLVSNQYGNVIAVASRKEKAEKMVALFSRHYKIDQSNYCIQKIPLDYIKLPGKKGINLSDDIARCPKCGDLIVEMSKAFSCINWKRGCRFSVWKVRCGASFTMEDAIELTKGKCVYKNNIDKDGNEYPASWALDENYEQRFKRLEQ